MRHIFNGGKEEPYAGEDRKLISSNKIATHDLAPEMKAKEITDEIIAARAEKASIILLWPTLPIWISSVIPEKRKNRYCGRNG